MKRILFILLISLTFFRGAYAQEDTLESPKLNISPSILSTNIVGGKTTTKYITIENFSSLAIPVGMEIKNYTLDENGSPQFFDTFIEYGAKDLIELDTKNIILEAGESREIEIQLNIPSKTPIGSHFATILFKPILPPNYFGAGSTHVIPYIGAVVIINVGNQDYASISNIFDIREFKPKAQSSSATKSLLLTAKMKNNDLFYHKPRGKIEIFDFFNRKVDEIELQEQTVLPGRVRNIEKTKEANSYLFGKYRAVLSISSENINLEEEKSFWIPPTLFEIALIILSLAIILNITWYILYIKISGKRVYVIDSIKALIRPNPIRQQ